MRELSVITYPHLRILPITSADNPRNISPQFTRLNIRSPAHPHFTGGRDQLWKSKLPLETYYV